MLLLTDLRLMVHFDYRIWRKSADKRFEQSKQLSALLSRA